jgi:hypothetical protein
MKRLQGASEPSQQAHEPGRVSDTPGSAAQPPRAGARKRYQRPVIEKRKSVAQATLFSGSGVPGVLTS